MPASQWNLFVKKNKGKKLSMTQLAEMYKKGEKPKPKVTAKAAPKAAPKPAPKVTVKAAPKAAPKKRLRHRCPDGFHRQCVNSEGKVVKVQYR